MTDAEYIEKIDMVSTEQLFESLDYYGCDSYYADLWNATINELKKRITPQGKWSDESKDSLLCSACGKRVYKPFIGGFPTERTSVVNIRTTKSQRLISALNVAQI